MPVFWWVGLDLVFLVGRAVSSGVFWGFCELSMILAASLLMGGVMFLSCLAWGIQQWSLLAIGWSWVLALRWRSLGDLLLVGITWGREVSGGPVP